MYSSKNLFKEEILKLLINKEDITGLSILQNFLLNAPDGAIAAFENKYRKYINEDNYIKIFNFFFEKQDIDQIFSMLESGILNNYLKDNVDNRNEMGNTLLHIICEYHKIVEDSEKVMADINYILKYKPNINLQDNNGNTVLHTTTNLEVCKLLITKKSAYINIKNIDGNTPLHALIINDLPIFEDIISNLNINEKNREGKTPLILAIETKNINNVSILMENDQIDLNNQNFKGDTALSISIKSRHIGIFEKLYYSDKSRKDIKDYNGFNLLHNALMYDNFTVIKFLFKNNLELFANDSMNRSPFSFIHYREILDFFLKEQSAVENLIIKKDIFGLNAVDWISHFYKNNIEKIRESYEIILVKTPSSHKEIKENQFILFYEQEKFFYLTSHNDDHHFLNGLEKQQYESLKNIYFTLSGEEQKLNNKDVNEEYLMSAVILKISEKSYTDEKAQETERILKQKKPAYYDHNINENPAHFGEMLRKIKIELITNPDNHCLFDNETKFSDEFIKRICSNIYFINPEHKRSYSNSVIAEMEKINKNDLIHSFLTTQIQILNEEYPLENIFPIITSQEMNKLYETLKSILKDEVLSIVNENLFQEFKDEELKTLLHIAAKDDNKEMILTFLQCGFRLNDLDKMGNAPIFYSENNKDIFMKNSINIIENNPYPNLTIFDAWGESLKNFPGSNECGGSYTYHGTYVAIEGQERVHNIIHEWGHRFVKLFNIDLVTALSEEFSYLKENKLLGINALGETEEDCKAIIRGLSSYSDDNQLEEFFVRMLQVVSKHGNEAVNFLEKNFGENIINKLNQIISKEESTNLMRLDEARHLKEIINIKVSNYRLNLILKDKKSSDRNDLSDDKIAFSENDNQLTENRKEIVEMNIQFSLLKLENKQLKTDLDIIKQTVLSKNEEITLLTLDNNRLKNENCHEKGSNLIQSFEINKLQKQIKTIESEQKVLHEHKASTNRLNKGNTHEKKNSLFIDNKSAPDFFEKTQSSINECNTDVPEKNISRNELCQNVIKK